MNPSAPVLGIIPARAHSTRFPFKILTPIAGKPMIQHVWEAACKSQSLGRVIVATDHADILNAVKGFGGEAVLTPNTLASGSDRVAFVAKDSTAQLIVNLQGDEPLLSAESIDELISGLQQHPTAGMATLAVRKPASQTAELNDPNVVKVVFDRGGRALYFSRLPLTATPAGDFYKHTGIYAFRRESLFQFCQLPPSELEKAERLEQLRALQNGIAIQVVTITADTIAVDTPQDVQKVEEFLAKLNRSALK